MNQGPGSSPYKLIDLVPIVREALQGNTSFSDNTACQWLQRSILNITDNYPFEELRTNGPIVNLPTGVSILQIPVASYINTNDDYTLMEDPVIFLDPPSNTIGYPMDYEDPKAIEPLLHVPGAIPFKYTRYGNYFLFGGLPVQSYPTFLRYQIKHPFAPDGNLQSTPCMFGTAWNEVFAYDAARRGAISLRWWDIGDKLRTLLYGDPQNQEGNPGLIKEVVAQQYKDQRNSSRQFMVRISRY
jgi:hypothetical protein